VARAEGYAVAIGWPEFPFPVMCAGKLLELPPRRKIPILWQEYLVFDAKAKPEGV